MTTTRLIKDSGERLAFGDNYFGISVTIVEHLILSITLVCRLLHSNRTNNLSNPQAVIGFVHQKNPQQHTCSDESQRDSKGKRPTQQQSLQRWKSTARMLF